MKWAADHGSHEISFIAQNNPTGSRAEDGGQGDETNEKRQGDFGTSAGQTCLFFSRRLLFRMLESRTYTGEIQLLPAPIAFRSCRASPSPPAADILSPHFFHYCKVARSVIASMIN
nr:hypothetical protein CFP56_25952 [Quercus suber]